MMSASDGVTSPLGCLCIRITAAVGLRSTAYRCYSSGGLRMLGRWALTGEGCGCPFEYLSFMGTPSSRPLRRFGASLFKESSPAGAMTEQEEGDGPMYVDPKKFPG